MKKFEELFDSKGVQKFVDNAIRDFKYQFKEGGYYIGEYFTATETIVSERVGCHQPSAVCHVFGITMEDLYGKDYLPNSKYDSIMQRHLWEIDGEWLPFDEVLDREGFYEDIERVLEEEYGERFEEFTLYGGELYLAWQEGEFTLAFSISDDDVAELAEDDDQESLVKAMKELYPDMEIEGKKEE